MTQGSQTTSFIADNSGKSQVIPVKAYAAKGASSPFGAFSFARRSPRAQDVQIEILYCGVCHSDLHQARGRVARFHAHRLPVRPRPRDRRPRGQGGSAVKKFKEGDLAAVGCMVDSCRECENCKAGEEQYCINFATFTYNSAPFATR